MILHYFGITKDTPDEMLEKVFSSPDEDLIKWQQKKDGYDALESGENMEMIVKKIYNLSGVTIERKNDSSKEKADLKYISDQIENNYPVWFSYGVLSKSSTEEGRGSGHIAVIRGFTKEGDIIVNEPWGDPANLFGYLRTQNDKNIITDGIPGYFYSPSDEIRKVAGLGRGDNCIIKQRDFLRILRGSTTNTPFFHQTLVIKYKHYWAFPLRGEEDAILRISDHKHDTTEEARVSFANTQMERMQGFITRGPVGYPVSSLGMPHYGLSVEADNEAPIYSIGPGRLIAAMVMPKAISFGRRNTPCFVLVQHQCMIGNANREFYSLYQHLRPVNVGEINEMIKRRMASSDNTGEPVKKIGWIDEIIDHIMPKRAIVRVKKGDEAEPLTGIVDSSMPRIKIKNANGAIVDTNPAEYLADRSLVYLCPTKKELRPPKKEKLEVMISSINLTFENENSLSRLFKEIDNEKEYMEKQGKDDYYCFFYYNKITSTVEKRYVLTSDIYPNSFVT